MDPQEVTDYIRRAYRVDGMGFVDEAQAADGTFTRKVMGPDLPGQLFTATHKVARVALAMACKQYFDAVAALPSKAPGIDKALAQIEQARDLLDEARSNWSHPAITGLYNVIEQELTGLYSFVAEEDRRAKEGGESNAAQHP